MLSFLFRTTSSVAVVAAAAALSIPSIAHAQIRGFSIPSQSAASGIREFGKQSGIQIVVSHEDADGRTTNAVHGNLDARAALDVLLTGTGLTVRSFDGGVAVLSGASEPRADIEEDTDEIQVTGTRVIRDGYDAPTPTTVLGEEEIARRAPENIADIVTTLPAVAAGNSPAQNTGTTASGFTGVNSLDLRNLGPSRTLVLLDGRRLPAGTINGSVVDINVIPNAFIKRVDVVTGGASAAWGSDADAGVVNFVLDKDFTGIKGKAQGGISTYGDRANYTLSLGAGAEFAGGRGHVLVNVEHSDIAGVDGVPRPWYTGYRTFANPNWTNTNGQPRYLSMEQVGYASFTPGGVVTTGPLRGTYFGENGTPGQLNYGTLLTADTFVGGDWKYTDWSKNTQALLNGNSRQNAFGRVSYDLTDNVQIFGQFLYTRSKVTEASPPFLTTVTVKRSNAFLPTEIGERMDELGLSTLTIGTSNADFDRRYESLHSLYQYLLGANGSLDLFGKGFTWEVSGYRNISKIGQDFQAFKSQPLANALDAVRGPNGSIVCASTLTDPGNGCVPYNPMGTGVNSSAVLDHIADWDWVRQTIRQDGFAATLRGEPASTWAGPISLATGVEYRREEAEGTAHPLGLVNGFTNGNYKPIEGSVDVTEGFMEIVVPFIKDSIFKSLDFAGAVRLTDYSSSGFVTTWKGGLTFQPTDDLKLRFTRSRDIRAGNLSELFAAGSTGTAVASDPFLEGVPTYTVQQITTGNPTIRPEKADTITVGAILTPSFAPGLSLSVDYWDIKIRDAITTASASATVSQCFNGNEDLCGNITRLPDGKIQYIYVRPVNLDLFAAKGIDVEASYRLRLSDLAASLGSGQITLRALATFNTKNGSESGLTGVFNSSLGEGGNPRRRYLVDIAYQNGPLTLSLTGRGLSSGVRDLTYIECSTNCPSGTNTINNNHIDGAFYVDAYFAHDITKEVEAFFVSTNIFNRYPIPSADGPGFSSGQFGYNRAYSDLGRTFRAGFRFKF